MRIKAAVARRAGEPLRIEPLDLDEPRQGEILIRLMASGVARVDRDAIAGTIPMALPFVPGSEAAGIVERAGPDVGTMAAGTAVLVAYGACGVCANCMAGDRRACRAFASRNLSGRRPDGSSPFADDGSAVNGFFFGQSSFATHLLCRAADVVAVDADVPLELFAGVCGEFLSGAAPILRREFRPDEAVLIAGTGIVGLAACMIAKAKGVGSIVVADPDEKRRNLALEVGATIAVPLDDGLLAVVASVAPGGACIALDASGTASGRRACIESLAPHGICAVTRSLASADRATDRPANEEARCESADADIAASDLVAKLVDLYRRGDLPIDKLVNFFPFELVNDALDAVATNAVVKAVLRFPLGSFGDLDRATTEGAAVDVAPGGTPSSEPAGEAADAGPAVNAPATA